MWIFAPDDKKSLKAAEKRVALFSMVEIFKKTKVATKNKAVFNKPIWANEIKYIGINSTVSNIYRFIEEILYSKTLDEYCNSINASAKYTKK